MESKKYMWIICWCVIMVLAGCQSRNGRTEQSEEVFDSLCMEESEGAFGPGDDETMETIWRNDGEGSDSMVEEETGDRIQVNSGNLTPEISEGNQTKSSRQESETVSNESGTAGTAVSGMDREPVSSEESSGVAVAQSTEESSAGEMSEVAEQVEESESAVESKETEKLCDSGHGGGNIQYFPCEPFCTAGSVGWYVCEVCGADYGHRDFPALGHDPVKENYRPGNCTEPELWDVVCSRCDELLEWDVQGEKDSGKHDYITLTLKKWDESKGDMVEYQEERCTLCGTVK